MVIKYKLGELAKDLNLPNKDVAAVFSGKFKDEKKHTTILSEAELNFAFDALSKKFSVENFDSFIAAGKKSEPKPAQNQTAQQPKPQAPQAPQGSKAPQGVQGAQRPQQPQNQNRPQGQNQNQPWQKKPFVQQGARPQNQNKPYNQHPNQGQNNVQNQAQAQAQNQALKQKNNPTGDRIRPLKPEKQKGETVSKERVVHHIDTRVSEVNIDKYNEKYDQIAQSSFNNNHRKNFNQSNKQKLNQRSKQRRGQRPVRETEAEKLMRIQLEKARKAQLKILIPEEIGVGELATRLKVTAAVVVKYLMSLGIMASVSDVIDFDTATLVAEDQGAKVEKEVVVTIEERLIDDTEDQTGDLVERNPIVVVMGHVDHGKTSLLDYIRQTNVIDGEAGGITQHIGAYRVAVPGDRFVTFLDTPGHEAFTSMRARGAMVTDIAILVVAADDGIMPQTIEAINHAKAAGVSVIVAINKIDKTAANVDKVKQQLTEHELVPEEWGGDIVCVPVSAKTGEGVPELLEMLTIVSDVKELKANPERLAKGSVIEARLDKGRGAVATLLVQNGTLKAGDVVIAGTVTGRVRTMSDDRGNLIEIAGPSTPVEITGFSEVPLAGDTFNAVEDERLARELADQRRTDEKERVFNSATKVTLDNLFSHIEEGQLKDLNIIVKADVQGSAEAVKQSLLKLSNEEVRVKVIHTGVGGINSSDIMLAEASGAIVVGFNVRPDATSIEQAEQKSVEMRMYRIIYDAINDVKDALKGMLAPKTREAERGRIEVREVYKISSVGTVAGCYIVSGNVSRGDLIRVVRDGIIIHDDKVASLRRFKDDVKEVATGFECGITLEKFADIKNGDLFESYVIEEYRD